MADQQSKKGKTPTFADRYSDAAKRSVAVDASSSRLTKTVDDNGKEQLKSTDYVLPQPDAVQNRVANQNFWVLTFCAPENARVRAKAVFIKCSGAFATEKEANAQAERIRAQDDRFDVSVVNMYQLGQVPPARDMEPFIEKAYTDKKLNSIMRGQRETLMQSKKELDDRIARDRAAAEAEMRKKYGPDYVPVSKSETVKQYEDMKFDRAEKAANMQFTPKDIAESFAKFIQGSDGTPGAIDPRAAGEFMRFLEAYKMSKDDMPPPPPTEVQGSSAPAAASASAPIPE
jgi:hypothetical protein